MPRVSPHDQLIVEVTFHHTADGYWGFAQQFPVSAHGENLQDCMNALCIALQNLLTAGTLVVRQAVRATADALIIVDNPYRAPVCAVQVFDPEWPRQPRKRRCGSSTSRPTAPQRPK